MFGTTAVGGLFSGKQQCGTVFKLIPPAPPSTTWTERSLYKFRCGRDGGNPASGPASDSSGNLYVATPDSGKGSCLGEYGCGAVVKLTPPSEAGKLWTTSVLYTFSGGADGGVAYGQPTVDPKGNLYGTTWEGGQAGNGTVFEITP